MRRPPMPCLMLRLVQHDTSSQRVNPPTRPTAKFAQMSQGSRPSLDVLLLEARPGHAEGILMRQPSAEWLYAVTVGSDI